MIRFRSTLYGNFIQKLCKKAGHDVISINYLGDWGTQFAILAIQWELMGKEGTRPDPEQWRAMNARNKIELLTQTYVTANTRVKPNVDLYARALKLFAQMEAAISVDPNAKEPEALEWWREWRTHSREYLEGFYTKFGVTFDKWESESEQINGSLFCLYASNRLHSETNRLVDWLIEKAIAFTNVENIWVVRDVGNAINVRKSDGATLYLTRSVCLVGFWKSQKPTR